MKNEETVHMIRARLTGEEYNDLTKDKIEELYIQEYGKLPPNFDVITAEELGIGNESGFDSTVIHFHNDDINEV